MLPGFRFVFATVVLAVSVLVFGLGAAALLRASHDQFANLPSAQAPREPDFVREQEAHQTTLALLRVEMTAERTDTTGVVETAAGETTAVPVAPAEVVIAPVSAIPARVPINVTATDDAPATPRPAAAISDTNGPADQPAAGDDGAAAVSKGPVIAAITNQTLDDKVGRPVATVDGPGCAPAAAAAPAAQIVLLPDPAPARTDAAELGRGTSLATPVQMEGTGKPVIRHARRSRLHYARLRRHRLALRYSAQSAALGGQQQQADPFVGFRR